MYKHSNYNKNVYDVKPDVYYTHEYCRNLYSVVI